MEHTAAPHDVRPLPAMTAGFGPDAVGGPWARLLTNSGEPSTGEQMLGFFARIAETVNAGTDVGTILRGVVDAVIRHTPWTQCWVGLIDAQTQEVIDSVGAGLRIEGNPHAQEWVFPGSASEHAVKTGRPLVMTDVTKETRFPGISAGALAAGYRATILVPFRVEQGWGIVQVTRPEAHRFTDLDVALTEIIASFAANAFRNIVVRAEAVDAERNANAHLAELNSVISEQNDALRWLSSVHERFLAAQLQSDGLDRQCRHIAEIVALPVAILDRFGAIVSDARLDDDDRARLRRSIEKNWPRLSRAQGGPIAIAEGERTLLLTKAAASGEDLATIVAVTDRDGATERVVRTLELSSVHVALTVLQERASLDAEVRLEQDFAEALQSEDGGEQTLTRRAAMLGIRLDRPAVVLRSRVTVDAGIGRREATEISALARTELARNRVDAVAAAISTTEFVFVVSVGTEDKRPPENTYTVIRRVLRDSVARLLGLPSARNAVSVVTGSGSVGTGVASLRQSHIGAVRAMEVLRSTGRPDADMSIDEAGSYALLTSASGPDRSAFVERYLGPLRAYDSAHGGDYVSTLRAYFAAVGNAQRVADDLFLHISTVRYRLSRIEEIARISLRDEEDRLCMQLALRIAGLERAAHSA